MRFFLFFILFFFSCHISHACSVAFYTGIDNDENPAYVYLTGRTADFLKAINPEYKHKINIYPRGRKCTGSSNYSDVRVDNPVTWTSKYASLIFDDFIDGVNEYGLCVHPLYLDKTVYTNSTDIAFGISNQKVTSYLLDNAKTVDECLELLDNVNIYMDKFGKAELRGDFPIHWAIRDALNNVVIIEFVKKAGENNSRPEKIVYKGTAEEYDVLTNEPPLKKQLRYYRKYQKGRRGLPGDFNAMARFVRLKMFKKTLPASGATQTLVNNMFSLMSTVHCIPGVVDYGHKEPKDEPQWPTAWTVVNDLLNKKYYIKTTSCPNLIWIDLSKFDFTTLNQTGELETENNNLIGEVNVNFTWE